MKTIAVFIFTGLLAASLPADCQATETPAQKIRRLEEMERTAISNGDTATLFRLWSAEYVVNNPNNMIMNAAQIKGYMQKGGMDHSAFTRNIEKITFMKDIAVVMGSEAAPVGNTGKTVTRRYTNVWIKSDTSWQLCARQATNIMQ